MENTSRGNRLHIGLYGKTNSGKSFLLNKIADQNVSIVSEQKGTTTDVVYKPMELLPIGPVVFMDTAGFGDETNLSDLRIEKTLNTLDKADVAIVVSTYDGWSDVEINIAQKLKELSTPFVAVVTKNDLKNIEKNKLDEIKKYTTNIILTDLNDGDLPKKIKDNLLKILPNDFVENRTITTDLIKEKDTVILVVPIDKEAPKGRLILPQVQVIRELLDKNAKVVVVKEQELSETFDELKTKPKLVITDSQVFKKVAEIVPNDVKLTSFSILFANFKGDIKSFVMGAKSLDNLNNGDKILFLESCTHHAVDDDIAKVKIPKLLEKKTNKKFEYFYHSGCSMPDNIADYSLLIHCGACMTNSKEVLSRIEIAQKNNVPITNYGVIIAYCLNILDRAIAPILDID